jgi:hypothetical protein
LKDLNSAVVHRNLDTKLKIVGLEVLDLLLVLIVSSFFSLFFDAGKFGFVFTFFIPLGMLVALFFIKRNKPDGYIKDVFRFYLSPGCYLASEELRKKEKLLKKIKKGKN